MRVYKEITPPPHLTRFLKQYWVLDVEIPHNFEMTNRIIPEGVFEILINYKAPYHDITKNRNKLPSTFASGPLNKYRIFQTHGSIGLFAIDFTPLGWYSLTNYHGKEFIDTAIDLELLTPKIRQLSDMLLNANNTNERISICNSFLTKKISGIDVDIFPILDIVNDIESVSGNIQMDNFLDKYNCSISKFERNFKKHIGISPKRFSKLIRFRKALELGQHYHWADFVFDLGFFDQAHFIKEFKEFIGVTPHNYFRSKNENKLPTPDKRSVVA